MTNATIETRIDGYFAKVGDAGKFFPIKQYTGYKDAQAAALAWVNSQVRFQDPGLSLDSCVKCLSRLYTLFDAVVEGFPILNVDARFVIDEHFQTVAVVFGSLLVTGSGGGYNVEIVTNWLTKQREIVCTDVSFSTAKEIVLHSPASKTFFDLNPHTLHLSDFNREVLYKTCVIE